MDSEGRLHMPNGFVGKSFKELDMLKEAPVKAGPEMEELKNRHDRRALEAMDRKLKELNKAL